MELPQLAKAVEGLKEEESINLTKEAIKQGIDPLKIIEEGIVKGLKAVGAKFERREAFVPDLIIAGELGGKCIKLIEAVLPPEKEVVKKNKVVLGTIKGDVHNIGKNLVGTFLTINGFEVYDVGEDVDPMVFVDKAEDVGADIIGISCLFLPSFGLIGDVINVLKDLGIREKYKVIMGGNPTNPEMAESAGCDGWGRDATEAVKLAKRLLGL